MEPLEQPDIEKVLRMNTPGTLTYTPHVPPTTSSSGSSSATTTPMKPTTTMSSIKTLTNTAHLPALAALAALNPFRYSRASE